MTAPDRAPPSPAYPYCHFLAWVALAGMIVAACLHQTNALVNIFAGLGLALLPALRLLAPASPPLIADPWLRRAVVLFLLGAVFHTVVPPLFLETAALREAALAESLHALWYTGKAAIGAALLLRLVRTRGDLAGLACLLSLTLLLVCLWSPIEHWLHGFVNDAPPNKPPYLLCGTKGNPTRYALTLFFAGFAGWNLLLLRSLRAARLPGWFELGGYLLAVLVPLTLRLRRGLPEIRTEHLFPGSGPHDPAAAALFYAQTALLILLGLALWHRLLRSWAGADGKRRIAALLTLGLIALNLGLTSARLASALFLLTATVAALLSLQAWKPALLRRWRALMAGALALLAVVGLAGGAMLAANPLVLDSSSLRIRLYVWRIAAEVVREHPVIGVGYGPERFQQGWLAHRLPLPPESPFHSIHTGDPLFKPQHAHNLYLQVLAERGVLGLATFLLLLLALGRALQRHTRAAFAAGDLWLAGAMSLTALGVLLLQGMLEYPLRLSNEILIWYAMALGLAAVQNLPPDATEPPR